MGMEVAQTKIEFHFGPNREAEGFAVEKAGEEGKPKHRYLVGVASGLKPDQHGERVTQKCIDSMVAQAKSGDVLLFPDLHGMGDSKDIGIMESFRVLESGDWWVEFRLYDESDQVGPETLETIEKIWKQVNGLPPYRKPRQKGFSIEGYIPSETGLLHREAYQEIDEIVLQGAIITPIPAYKDSVAHAVYKALGEKAPWMIQKDIRSKLYDSMIDRETQDAYNREHWNIQGALEDMISELMKSEELDKEGKLKLLFTEYQDLMVQLILKSAAIFKEDATVDQEPDEASPYSAETPKSELFVQLRAKVERLVAIQKEKAT